MFQSITKKKRRQKKRGWGKGTKAGAKSRGKDDEERRQKQEAKISSVTAALEILEDPFQSMNIIQKKKHTLYLYSKKQHEAINRGEQIRTSKAQLLVEVSNIVGVSVRAIRNWLQDFEAEQEIKASMRGRHPSTKSPIVDPRFRTKFCTYVREHSSEQGKPSLSTTMLAAWVNTQLGLREENYYSPNAIRLWLHNCGFMVR